MAGYPVTPDEFRRQWKSTSGDQVLLHCHAEGSINGWGSSGGELVWTTQRIAFRPGSLDRLTFKHGRLRREWTLHEILEVEVRRGRPIGLSIETFLSTLVEVMIVLPILAVFTLGIGAIMWLADRLAGTHLIVKTPSDRAWFFLKKTSIQDAEKALSLFDLE